MTNGIDTILLRKAREAGITDFRAPEAPSSMVEAVKRFFPHVVEGKIQRLEPTQRTALAQQCIQVAVQRPYRKNHQYPTYTMIDAGDGQLPQDFAKTTNVLFFLKHFRKFEPQKIQKYTKVALCTNKAHIFSMFATDYTNLHKFLSVSG